MKCIIFLTIFLIVSCNYPKELMNENGKLVIQKHHTILDSSIITGNIFELQTGEKLKLCDIWVENRRYESDTTGYFKITLPSGKYEVEARSFGFNNFKHSIIIKKGEIVNLHYFLVPFKSQNQNNNIH
ncbi:MAG: hypothetical protein EAZ12_00290 [Sphingobacteriia bacterium]|nr:MAG: hypothetical protein EAZ12_00290 [Sphingobacteriia bacterium]